MTQPRLHCWPGLAAAVATAQRGDSAEIKVLIAPEHHDSAITALGLDSTDARLGQVYYFDTPDLRLHRHGVVARARRTHRRPDDAVVKLRRPARASLTTGPRHSSHLYAEVDALPGVVIWSASVRNRLGPGRVRHTVRGNRAVATLFSPDQQRFLRAATGGVDLDRLVVLGPVTVTRLRAAPLCPGGRTALEIWRYPDGSQIMELTTRCLASRAVRTAAATTELLDHLGVAPSDVQQTKTRASLLAFTARAAAPCR